MVLLGALRLPLAGALAERDRARERVAADLAAVLRDGLLAVALPGDLELHLAVLEAGLFDRRLGVVPAAHGAGELVAFQLELERRLHLLAVALRGPLPGAVGFFLGRRDRRHERQAHEGRQGVADHSFLLREATHTPFES